MKIINLAEDTRGRQNCPIQHGLSFYIETAHHKVLMDTGASGLFLKNAKRLGVDLGQVDTVIISHGHYDHGGGVLAFAQQYPDAKIYLQKSAFENYYSIHSDREEPRNIGLDPEIQKLPQVVLLDGNYRIDQELFLFSDIEKIHPLPSANRALKQQTPDGLIPDIFRHEQCLVIHQLNLNVLLSGCAHNGIRNILERYRELYKRDPDYVISGFHMMKKYGYTRSDYSEIVHTAYALKNTAATFYTCHCTGTRPYGIMKNIMGRQLQYIHCGDTVNLKPVRSAARTLRRHICFLP